MAAPVENGTHAESTRRTRQRQQQSHQIGLPACAGFMKNLLQIRPRCCNADTARLRRLLHCVPSHETSRQLGFRRTQAIELAQQHVVDQSFLRRIDKQNANGRPQRRQCAIRRSAAMMRSRSGFVSMWETKSEVDTGFPFDPSPNARAVRWSACRPPRDVTGGGIAASPRLGDALEFRRVRCGRGRVGQNCRRIFAVRAFGRRRRTGRFGIGRRARLVRNRGRRSSRRRLRGRG